MNYRTHSLSKTLRKLFRKVYSASYSWPLLSPSYMPQIVSAAHVHCNYITHTQHLPTQVILIQILIIQILHYFFYNTWCKQ